MKIDSFQINRCNDKTKTGNETNQHKLSLKKQDKSARGGVGKRERERGRAGKTETGSERTQ